MSTPEKMKLRDLLFHEDDVITQISQDVLIKANRVRSEIRQVIEESQKTKQHYS